MNRFYQGQKQDYVPLPFEDILRASSFVNQRKDKAMADMSAVQNTANSLLAAPGTKDEQEVSKIQSGINDLLNSYSSDPNKYMASNATFEFNREANKIMGDRTKLKRYEGTYNAWKENQAQEKQLTKEGKFHPLLSTNDMLNGYSSDESGVFDRYTKPFDSSLEYSDAVFSKIQPDSFYDEEGRVQTGGISEQKIADAAMASAPDFAQTPNFESQVVTRYHINPNSLNPDERLHLANTILFEDGQRFKREMEKGTLTPQKQTNPRGNTQGGGSTLPDLSNILVDEGDTELTGNQLPAVLGVPSSAMNPDGTINISGDNTMVMAYPKVIPGVNISPKDNVALNAYITARSAIAAHQAALKDTKEVTKDMFWAGDIKDRNFGIPAPKDLRAAASSTTNAAAAASAKANKEFREKIKALGYSLSDFQPGKNGEPNGRMYDLLNQIEKVPNAEEAMAMSGALVELNKGPIKFQPDYGTDNLHNIEGPDGIISNVSGTALFSEAELEARLKGDNKLSKLIDKGYVQDTGKQDADGKPIYAVPMYKPVKITSNIRDEFNKAKYGGDSKEVRESLGQWPLEYEAANAKKVQDLKEINSRFKDVNGQRIQDPVKVNADADEVIKGLENYDPEADKYKQATGVGTFDTMKQKQMYLEDLNNAKNQLLKYGSKTPPNDVLRDFQELINHGRQAIEATPPQLRNNNPNGVTTIGVGNNNPANIKGAFTKRKLSDSELQDLRVKYKDPGLTIDYDHEAQDGGYFIKFSNMNVGREAHKNLLSSGSYSKLNLDTAMRRWSNNGYGADIFPQGKGKTIQQIIDDGQLDDLLSAMRRRESRTA